jgi:hypothetical protein
MFIDSQKNVYKALDLQYINGFRYMKQILDIRKWSVVAKKATQLRVIGNARGDLFQSGK